MNAGTIVERGTHDELVKVDNGVYAKLLKKQLQ